MTRQEAIDELHKHYVPEYVNYIVTALTDGATPSDAPTINAIPIPEDATNGDVIKAVFPNVKIIVSETGEIAHIHENTLIKDNFMFVQVSTKWLSTPYKAESEEV